ncbi:hypothetical protein [Mucilaginibacter pedocola]|uniref:DoxX family protein n=1 Tax=Mucilaginibacter pedocola TaxID=1792845 RepID=A0A1S9PJ85_9SPHI|nr:hypothetical protein [Mucilaginibacter pedocola]OOQ60638.1 hypothetical protein BC343_23870 [Mucilaginibacter pedocola]
MKVLSPSKHIYADFMLTLFLWAAPTIFVLPGSSGQYVYLMGFAQLLLAVCTNSTGSIFRFFSMPVHGLIEVCTGVLLVVLSFTWSEYDLRMKPFYITYATLLFVLNFVTDHKDVAAKTRRFKNASPLQGTRTMA